MIKKFGKDDDFEAAKAKKDRMKAESKGIATEQLSLAAGAIGTIHKIIFACDAGMGSSAMGATIHLATRQSRESIRGSDQAL